MSELRALKKGIESAIDDIYAVANKELKPLGVYESGIVKGLIWVLSVIREIDNGRNKTMHSEEPIRNTKTGSNKAKQKVKRGGIH